MQDTNIPENKVIIIGGDHHNGLGLARIFGLNGKKVFAVVISNKKKSWMATSKFVEGHAVFKTEKEGFDYILKTFSSEIQKPVLIPYSDAAALELDLRLTQFKEKFHVPSINGELGKIASMMDKDAQYKWSMEHGIKMAKSFVFNVDDSLEMIVSAVGFPIILKPIVSAKGSKFDITVCENEAQLKASMQLLSQKGYTSILVQKYLSKRSEMLIVGAIADENVFSVHEVIRRWPDPGGCGSFSQAVIDEKILEKCSRLIEKIAKYGYQGLIDIETFLVDGDIYLNEINWRNSGGCFRAIDDGFFYAYWWYKKITDKEAFPCWTPKASLSMVEYADFRHVLKKGLSPLKWMRDFGKTKNLSLLRKDDLKPFFFKILYGVTI